MGRESLASSHVWLWFRGFGCWTAPGWSILAWNQPHCPRSQAPSIGSRNSHPSNTTHCLGQWLDPTWPHCETWDWGLGTWKRQETQDWSMTFRLNLQAITVVSTPEKWEDNHNLIWTATSHCWPSAYSLDRFHWLHQGYNLDTLLVCNLFIHVAFIYLFICMCVIYLYMHIYT